MALFSQANMAKINQAVSRSKELAAPPPKVSTKSINTDLQVISQNVVEYFKDSKSILITSEEQLSEYIDECIKAGYAGIDTETTGLDRIKDTIVGSSLYYPGGQECYIPNKHIVPIFDEPYKNQLTYEQCQRQFQRLVDAKVKMIFANADFDLAMIYKDYKVDFIDTCYYDVILAWRCLKENELHNDLKSLYNKYVLRGKGDPKRFSDFFPTQLFPYCKPEVAKLYAANDAKITFELFKWQLPYLTKTHPKCQKAHLEKIADLVWNVEFPLIKVCQNLFRTGMYIDQEVAARLREKYNGEREREMEKLRDMVQDVVDHVDFPVGKAPFHSGKDFNPTSPPHVKHLLYTLMKLPQGPKSGTGKEVLHEINLPITNQILKVRSLGVLINTFVDKLPKSVAPDGRIHAQFRSVGAATGRFSSAEPNLQNIPSHAVDIRHMFRATPGYMMIGSDYSAQEPRITAYVSSDRTMIESFQEGKDIYGTIASVAFNLPYEKCLEFHPETHEYQPDGKARRSEAKTIVLGITYGRSVPSIAEQMYGTRDDMSDEEKIKAAQHIYDSVLNAFPNLRKAMIDAQTSAKVHGYTETILGRRRHLPDMQLSEFEFKAMAGYVNPDIDPLDTSTLHKSSDIPERIVKQLEKEFKSYKYFGQIAKRTKELAEEHIRVINNRPKINDASRQCLNSIIQGSAADQTKLAILLIENNEEWKKLGAHLLVPVHDELIAEAPIENAEEAGKLLSKLMCEAASFLPFDSKCDVEQSWRWYGMEAPCPYKEPLYFNLDEMVEDEVKWVQYHVVECEYPLPVFKDENGEKPRGDAAKGVNGLVTDELKSIVQDYCHRYSITTDEFISHIKKRVQEGTVK